MEPTYIKGTLIVLAVYINNNNISYDILILCLKHLRNVYKNETIITVDNGSLNTNWHEIAKNLNMIILHNNSDIHRYEMGAYKLALEHYRADKYIFSQGTIVLNNLDLSVLDNQEKINVLVLNFWHDPDNGNFRYDPNGIILINKLLSELKLSDWFDYPYIATDNTFCCNNLLINKMFEDGLFDISSETKLHSMSFERILGYYFKLKADNIYELPKNMYYKQSLAQHFS